MHQIIVDWLVDQIATKHYADLVGGVVMPYTRTVSDADGKMKQYVYPGIVKGYGIADCEPYDIFEIAPDSTRKSIIFFEDVTGAQVVKEDGRFTLFSATVRMVGWLNLPQLGLSGQAGWGTKVMMDLLSLLPNGLVNIPSHHINRALIVVGKTLPRGRGVWQGYSVYRERKDFLNEARYDHFCVELELTWQMSKSCFAAIPQNAPDECEPLPIVRTTTVNGVPSATQVITITKDGEPYGTFDPVTGHVTITCGPAAVATTVNGVTSETETIHVQQSGVPTGTFDPVTGIVDVPECQPATVANSDGSKAWIVPSDGGLILPDISVRNNTGTLLATIPAANDFDIPAVPWTNSNGLPQLTPYMDPIICTPLPPPATTTVNGVVSETHAITITQGGAPVGVMNPATGEVGIPPCASGTVQPRDSVNTNVGPLVSVASGGAVFAPIPDATVQMKDTANNDLGTPINVLAAEVGKIIVAPNSSITLENGTIVPVRSGQAYSVPSTRTLKLLWNKYHSYAKITVTAELAGPYTSFTQDGGSGAQTYRIGGTDPYAAGYVAPTGTVTLVLGTTLWLKRATKTADGTLTWVP